MTIDDLLSVMSEGDFKKIYRVCTSQRKQIDIVKLRNEWNPEDHDVMNPLLRKNKKKTVTDDNGVESTIQEPVNRIALPLQRHIVNKAVSFLFGNPVNVTAVTKNESEEAALAAVQKVLHDVKADSKNREIARNIFRATEAAELWYVVPSDKHSDYGFESEVRIRMASYSPWEDGVSVYTLFDDQNDMIALCKEFSTKNADNKSTAVFEIYTANTTQRWRREASKPWEIFVNAPNPIKKIQGVYGEQEESEWNVVQSAITRIETLISNHGDINDYNGDPILASHGEILSMGDKNDRGKIIEIIDGGKLEYVSWDAAPESIKMELENLLTFVHQFTNTPEVNRDHLKGMSQISGIALKLLFMDAHLKVMDKREMFDPYLSRRNSVIVAILKHISAGALPGLTTLQLRNEITPYMIEDRKELVDMLATAGGGVAFASRKTLIKKAAFVDDPETEEAQIEKEAKAATNLIDDEPINDEE